MVRAQDGFRLVSRSVLIYLPLPTWSGEASKQARTLVKAYRWVWLHASIDHLAVAT